MPGPLSPTPAQSLQPAIALGAGRFAVEAHVSLLAGKGHDTLRVAPGFAAVLDGVTPSRPEDGPAVRRFVDTAAALLHRHRRLPGSEQMRQTASDLRRLGLSGDVSPACTVALARSCAEGISIDVIGDSIAIVEHQGGISVVRDPALDRWRALQSDLAHIFSMQGVPHDEAMRRLAVTRRWIGTHANREGGWWVLSGNVEAAGHAVSQRFAPGAVRAVLLSTDGFVAQAIDLGIAPDEAGVYGAVRSGGVEAVLDEMRRREALDPQCLTHPRYAVRDDATAILLVRHAQGEATKPRSWVS